MYYELFGYQKISNRLSPKLWIALNDMTPRVSSERQAVYCHNATPFYKVSWSETKVEPKLLLFSLLYKYIYAFGMHRNYAVIVQQNWLRKIFIEKFHHKNIIVAYPLNSRTSTNINAAIGVKRPIFIYPTFSRAFKNVEIICQAVSLLPASLCRELQIRITIDGTENRYSRDLLNRYGALEGLKFIGRQDAAEMAKQYEECQVLIFPSKLETWGLPISEARILGKSLLVADLPYAYESVGTYEKIEFIPVDDAKAWAEAIESIFLSTWKPPGNILRNPAPPFAPDWGHLWAELVRGL